MRRTYQVADGNVFVTVDDSAVTSPLLDQLASADYQSVQVVAKSAADQHALAAGTAELVTANGLTQIDNDAATGAVTLLAQAAAGAGRAPATLKAALLAGAARGSLSGWSESDTAPLDPYYGAGLADPFGAADVWAGGQHVSGSTESGGARGWDTGTGASGTARTYYFSVPAGKVLELSAALSWDRPATLSSSGVTWTAALPNLDLYVKQTDAGGVVGQTVAQSIGTGGNRQYVSPDALPAGNYCLQVSSDTDAIPYGLAWSGVLMDAPVPLAISWTGAADGSQVDVGTAVTLSASVSGDAPTLSRVDFQVNGSVVGSASSAPYSMSWSPSASGSYSVHAVAVGGDGSTISTGAVTITANAPAPAPVPLAISWTGAADGSQVDVGTAVTLSASVSGETPTLSRVDFEVNGSVVGSASSAPYSTGWTASAAGTYALRAVAVGSDGSTLSTGSVSVTVNAPVTTSPTPTSTPLSISWSGPADGSSYPSGKAIYMEATVSGDSPALSEVDFTADGQVVGTATSAPFATTWTPATDGSHTLSAVAVGVDGSRVETMPVSISVEAPVQAVQVPSSGYYFGSSTGITSGGFGFYLRDNKTAVLIIGGSDGQGASAYNVPVDNSGNFSVSQVSVYTKGSATPVLSSISGTVTDSQVTGTVDALGWTFSGTRSADTGDAQSVAGFYQNYVINSENGLIYTIVGADGRAFALALSGSAATGVAGTVDSSGAFSTPTGTIIAQLQSGSGVSSGTWTLPSGATEKFAGLAEGQPGTERMVNISTRGYVGTGAKAMIAGFVISGTGPKTVLIRAVGPGLAGMGISNPIADPQLELDHMVNGQASVVGSNDNWNSSDTAVTSAISKVGAFPLKAGSKDSVMLVTLKPGVYTAKVTGVSGGEGIGLVEVYDADSTAADPTAKRLVNISTRGFVGTGNQVLISGFVVSGNVPKQVLIRGIGPSLQKYGVSGVLKDPILKLIRIDKGQTTDVASNDNWGSAGDTAAVESVAKSVGAASIDPGTKDSALLIWLEPGVYTAILSSADGSTGIGMIEAYDVPR